MSNIYDVVIVGGGPTGLMLANLLGQAGRSVLLVEANQATVSEPRAVSIDDESLRAVQSIGLIDVVMSEVVPGYGSEYRAPNGSLFLKVFPREEPYGHPRRNAFRQPVFEAQLRAGVERFSDVTLLFQATVEGFRESPDDVEVDVRVCGQIQKFRGRYLIGADGARSRTRQQLGAKLVGDSMDERWLIVDLAHSPVETPETIVFCNASRPCIALPGPRLTRRFEFKLHPRERDEDLLAEDSVLRLLKSHGAAEDSQIVRKTVYHFHALVADCWGRGRVWLAGDAAHLSPPFAGQGMNSGLRDAVNLAWKLDQVLSGRLGPALLNTYQTERQSHVVQMIQLAVRMGSIMGPRSRLAGVLMRSGFHFLGLWPGARSYFAEMKYKPPPRFHNGFLLRKGRRGIVGRMIPQPRMTDGPAAGRHLDEWLNEGFVLVGVDIKQDVMRDLALGPHWNSVIAARLALPSHWAKGFDQYSGECLLLRPDRYVMARFTPAQSETAIQALEALWQETWQ